MTPPDDYSARDLEQARVLYEQGDKGQILFWLDWCLASDVQVPPWLKEAFCEACNARRAYRIKSWDDVFDPPVPKSTRLAINRQKLKIAWPLFERIYDLHAADPANWPMAKNCSRKSARTSDSAKQWRLSSTMKWTESCKSWLPTLIILRTGKRS
jgi:hypothetical protein